MHYAVGVLSFLIGMLAGFALPDWDLRLGPLTHRSIVTHGLLWPLLFFWIARRWPRTASRTFAMGLSLASAIHLSFDLFPQAWTGFALIHIPLLGRTPALFSWLWIAASVVACMYFALSLVNGLFEMTLATGSLLVAFGYYTVQEGLVWGPLAALVVSTAVALVLPHRRRKPSRSLPYG